MEHQIKELQDRVILAEKCMGTLYAVCGFLQRDDLKSELLPYQRKYPICLVKEMKDYAKNESTKE